MKSSFIRRPVHTLIKVCLWWWFVKTATTAAAVVIRIFQWTRVDSRVWQLELVEKYATILLDMICKGTSSLMYPYHRLSNSPGGHTSTRYCQVLAQVNPNDLHAVRVLVTSRRGTWSQKKKEKHISYSRTINHCYLTYIISQQNTLL